MKNKIRVDYHFHPNFSFHLPLLGRLFSKPKAHKTWKAFKKNNLDVVLITEHSYKRPRKVFELLEKTKPKDSQIIIIPGIEILTKEGTDLIVFSKEKDHIYSHECLLTPFKLTTLEAIEFIEQDENLYGIVVHPHTPGTTSIVRNNGMDLTKEAIKRLGFLEKHNCAFCRPIKFLEKIKLDKLFKKKFKQMEETFHAPEELLELAEIHTIGSDAHHISDIGDCSEIECAIDKDLDFLFKIITTQQGELSIKKKLGASNIIGSGTFLMEWILKKTRFYSIDKPL